MIQNEILPVVTCIEIDEPQKNKFLYLFREALPCEEITFKLVTSCINNL